jgi:hypothetical protein
MSDRKQRSVSSVTPAELGRSPLHRPPVLPSDHLFRRAGCRSAPRTWGSGRIGSHAKPAPKCAIKNMEQTVRPIFTSKTAVVLAERNERRPLSTNFGWERGASAPIQIVSPTGSLSAVEAGVNQFRTVALADTNQNCCDPGLLR